MPVPSLQAAVPDEKDLEEDTSQDLGRAAATATVTDPTSGGLRAAVQFDYDKAEDNEIDLREGEVVTEIDMVDEDWWLGVNTKGERGLFPANYVEVVEDDHAGSHVPAPAAEPEPELASTPAPAPAPVPAPAPAAEPVSSKGPTATAIYDYEAAEDNELSFPENAKILNVVSISSLHRTACFPAPILTMNDRNSPTTTGGLESTRAHGGCSRPTTCSWMRRREMAVKCVNSVVFSTSSARVFIYLYTYDCVARIIDM